MDLSSPVYPYQQIAKQLRDKIADGTITGQLPTIKEIQDSTTPPAAYNTVRHAIKVLVDEGLVETAPGRGTFVRRQA